MKNWICYDGVERDVYLFNTEQEAQDKLKWVIDNGTEYGEWMDGVEHSFVAKINHRVEAIKLEFDNDGCTAEDTVDMQIYKVDEK